MEGALNSASGELASPSDSEAKKWSCLGHVNSPGICAHHLARERLEDCKDSKNL